MDNAEKINEIKQILKEWDNENYNPDVALEDIWCIVMEM